MLEFVSHLSHWIQGFAHSDWVLVVLAIVSFVESVFSPFPPDPILIAAAVFNPELALVFAGVTTVASVAGAVLGHWLGDRFGRPLLDRFVSAAKVQQVEVLFQKYGVWAILLAAVTPIPYKVFAITAGVMEMKMKPFLVASFIGRGARMFLWAVLVLLFGDTALDLLETQGLWLGAALGAVVIVSFLLYLLYTRLRSREPEAG